MLASSDIVASRVQQMEYDVHCRASAPSSITNVFGAILPHPPEAI